jgi:signal transduction histidine kinase
LGPPRSEFDTSTRNYLHVEVIDTGVGISEEDQKHLFKLFGKLKTTFHINQQGIGLGLSISKQICEHLGGKVSVTSKLNEGSNFSFEVALSGVRVPSSIPTLKNLSFDS